MTATTAVSWPKLPGLRLTLAVTQHEEREDLGPEAPEGYPTFREASFRLRGVLTDTVTKKSYDVSDGADQGGHVFSRCGARTPKELLEQCEGEVVHRLLFRAMLSLEGKQLIDTACIRSRA